MFIRILLFLTLVSSAIHWLIDWTSDTNFLSRNYFSKELIPRLIKLNNIPVEPVATAHNSCWRPAGAGRPQLLCSVATVSTVLFGLIISQVVRNTYRVVRLPLNLTVCGVRRMQLTTVPLGMSARRCLA